MKRRFCKYPIVQWWEGECKFVHFDLSLLCSCRMSHIVLHLTVGCHRWMLVTRVGLCIGIAEGTYSDMTVKTWSYHLHSNSVSILWFHISRKPLKQLWDCYEHLVTEMQEMCWWYPGKESSRTWKGNDCGLELGLSLIKAGELWVQPPHREIPNAGELGIITLGFFLGVHV